MYVKRMARAAVVAASLSTSALIFGTGPVSAVPLDPPPSPISPSDPGEPQVDVPTPPAGGTIALPHSGGSIHGGHPATQLPPPGAP
jgi:hypothetical protein